MFSWFRSGGVLTSTHILLSQCGQHNYASKTRCIRSRCAKTRGEGDVAEMNRKALAKAKAAHLADPDNGERQRPATVVPRCLL